MSYDGDSTQIDLVLLSLLEAILTQLRLQTEILREMSDIEIREDDLDG